MTIFVLRSAHRKIFFQRCFFDIIFALNGVKYYQRIKKAPVMVNSANRSVDLTKKYRE